MTMSSLGPEDQLQIAVAQLIDAHGWFWWHTPNEGKRSPRGGKLLKRKGLLPGVVDVIVWEKWAKTDGASPWSCGMGVAIELKAGRNEPTDAQSEFLRRAKARGCLTGVCRTVDEVQEILRHVRPHNGRRMR
jgi:hypothetical protein